MKLQNRKMLMLGSSVIVVTALAYMLFTQFQTRQAASSLANAATPKTPSFLSAPIPIEQYTLKYGFVLDNYEVTEAKVGKNEFLSDLLVKHKVSYQQIELLVNKAKAVFDVRKIQTGKSYMILSSKDGEKKAQYFIYEPSPFRYVVYELTGETDAKTVERPVDVLVKENSGVVTSSLWNAIVDNGMTYGVAAKMEEVLAWSLDFHQIRKGDRFKLVYEEQFIEGELVGIGRIHAAYFKNGSKEFNAYYYEDEKHKGYFDAEGRPMKKAFLQAPVQFSRISSPYNLKRFHPILRRVKAHLGTDYAAPYGTPILAVASGTVVKAEVSGGNGRYVKLRHDKVYETQYLHMQKFAAGIRPGVRVNQGDVIGYVGSTGLATGPHVCFRFWKNGQQVDHRRENLPPPNPMTGESLEAFKKVQSELQAKLEKIEFAEVADGAKSKGEQKIIDP